MGAHGRAGNADVQAVVLCGPGHRLGAVVGDESVLPKCLVPVANKPMLHYPLALLAAAGITDVLVVVHASAAPRVAHFLARGFDAGAAGAARPAEGLPAAEGELGRGTQGGPRRPELVVLDEYRGTVDALLAVRARVHGDVLVLPCDVVTDYPLQTLVDESRMPAADGALLVALLAGPVAANYGLAPKAPQKGARTEASDEPSHRGGDEGGVLVGLAAPCASGPGLPAGRARRLVLYAPLDDLDDAGGVSLPLAALGRVPVVEARAGLRDTHVYLVRRRLFALSDARVAALFRLRPCAPGGGASVSSRLFSVREELLPRLVRGQFGADEHYSVAAIVVDAPHYCVRVNTLAALAEMSKQLARHMMLAAASSQAAPRLVSQAAEVGQKTQVGPDSLVGDHTLIAERCAVKRCVIGAHVRIAAGARLSNCLVLDGAAVGEGARLEGCILGPRAVVRDRAQLRDCDVGADRTVDALVSARGELFGGAHGIFVDDD